jgi:hypothetical protein
MLLLSSRISRDTSNIYTTLRSKRACISCLHKKKFGIKETTAAHSFVNPALYIHARNISFTRLMPECGIVYWDSSLPTAKFKRLPFISSTALIVNTVNSPRDVAASMSVLSVTVLMIT